MKLTTDPIECLPDPDERGLGSPLALRSRLYHLFLGYYAYPTGVWNSVQYWGYHFGGFTADRIRHRDVLAADLLERLPK